ncbi:MAG: UDP-N-acetylglucosamine 1-carboxyvinyltransferase [Patescibacteria group bacterium]|nr:MAG: UDP-N-acetylglucosamine 1-carboxyvinyltransferase [Patescibacteria group bacterium]
MNGMNDKFLIKGLGGRKTLCGSIVVGGAKNAALKLMAASVLFRDEIVLGNVPDIEDVKKMASLLEFLGARVRTKNKHTYALAFGRGLGTDLSSDISKQMRASIVLVGPLLARFGRVSFPHPGGCVIGERPIDLFLEGFKKMGAVVRMRRGTYTLRVPQRKLYGATIFLKNQSVTATETFMMAGVLARGETVIKNASLEPEIVELAGFLTAGGARISGAGTPTIRIKGGALLSARGKMHRVCPDRIEAGSFLIFGALCAKELEIKKCNPAHIESLIEALRASGVKMEVRKTSIKVFGGSHRAVDIKTHEYPGFPTDLQAPMTVFLTQARGESLVFETIFDGRLNYVESLEAFGADITVMDPHRIIVRGPTVLHGKVVESPDLRAGLAFLIAAIVAKGRSVIHNVHNIDRGYEKVEDRLKGIGVDIVRIPDGSN